MANYANDGNRYTKILVRRPQHGAEDLFVEAPYELIRFNVDVDPSARAYVVPVGFDAVNQIGTKNESPRIYEKVWITDTLPWSPGQGGKVWFGKLEW